MNDQPDSAQQEKKNGTFPPGTGIALGVALGVALGAAFNDLAIGIGCGIAIGAGFESSSYAKKKEIKK